jgi:hypothetical protein
MASKRLPAGISIPDLSGAQRQRIAEYVDNLRAIALADPKQAIRLFVIAASLEGLLDETVRRERRTLH